MKFSKIIMWHNWIVYEMLNEYNLNPQKKTEEAEVTSIGKALSTSKAVSTTKVINFQKL